MLPQLSMWPPLIRMVQGEGSLPSPLRPAGQLRAGPAAVGAASIGRPERDTSAL